MEEKPSDQMANDFVNWMPMVWVGLFFFVSTMVGVQAVDTT